ncbi:MAG: hypothetical protein IT368_16885 [Candidatus Hydrogenedentes bacterium]|nr:hypothetical protein [Candidatus Hydrogenedentota bacterium]
MSYRTSRVRKWKGIGLISLGHMAVACGSLMLSVGGISIDHPPTMTDVYLDLIVSILNSPVAWPLMQSDITRGWFPGLLGYIPFLCNSIIWGYVIWHLFAYRRLSRYLRTLDATAVVTPVVPATLENS